MKEVLTGSAMQAAKLDAMTEMSVEDIRSYCADEDIYAALH